MVEWSQQRLNTPVLFTQAEAKSQVPPLKACTGSSGLPGLGRRRLLSATPVALKHVSNMVLSPAVTHNWVFSFVSQTSRSPPSRWGPGAAGPRFSASLHTTHGLFYSVLITDWTLNTLQRLWPALVLSFWSFLTTFKLSGQLSSQNQELPLLDQASWSLWLETFSIKYRRLWIPWT